MKPRDSMCLRASPSVKLLAPGTGAAADGAVAGDVVPEVYASTGPAANRGSVAAMIRCSFISSVPVPVVYAARAEWRFQRAVRWRSLDFACSVNSAVSSDENRENSF